MEILNWRTLTSKSRSFLANRSSLRLGGSPFTRQFCSFLIILTLIGVVLPFSGQSQTPPEYKIKAVYLYNFVQFVDWPTNAFADPQSPLVIGILGEDPFGTFLRETVAGETVKGRKIELRQFEGIQEVEDCHMLFISGSERRRLKTILASLKGRSILTVGELEGFATEGGMVRFITENNKIRFRINLEAAKEGNLSFSSKLLQLAEIVPTKRE